MMTRSCSFQSVKIPFSLFISTGDLVVGISPLPIATTPGMRPTFPMSACLSKQGSVGWSSSRPMRCTMMAWEDGETRRE